MRPFQVKMGLVQSRVAASSAAWGWRSSKSSATIPKSFGFEAATRYGASNQCYPESDLFEPGLKMYFPALTKYRLTTCVIGVSMDIVGFDCYSAVESGGILEVAVRWIPAQYVFSQVKAIPIPIRDNRDEAATQSSSRLEPKAEWRDLFRIDFSTSSQLALGLRSK